MSEVIIYDEYRCAVCSGELSIDRRMKDLSHFICPLCGAQVQPYRADLIVDLKISWSELRVLTIYALRWAEQFRAQVDKNKVARDHIMAFDQIITLINAIKPKDGSPLNYKEFTSKPLDRGGQGSGIKSPYFKKKKE